MLKPLIRSFIFVCCLALIISCAGANNKAVSIKSSKAKIMTLHIDSNFSKLQQGVILSSFKEWEYASKQILIFRESGTEWNSITGFMEGNNEDSNGCSTDIYVAKLTSKTKSVVDFEKRHGEPGNTLGWTARSCLMTYIGLIVDRIDTNIRLRSVTVHEAGHVVGLNHIPIPKESIMFPSMDHAARCITSLDMKQLCLIYECNWKDMNYCD